MTPPGPYRSASAERDDRGLSWLQSREHPPLLIATVQQLRAAGWSEAKIATAAERKAARDRGAGGA